MTEYVLLVGVVVILLVGAVKGLGASVGTAFDATTGKLEKVAELVSTVEDEAAPGPGRPGALSLVEDEDEDQDDLSLPGRVPPE